MNSTYSSSSYGGFGDGDFELDDADDADDAERVNILSTEAPAAAVTAELAARVLLGRAGIVGLLAVAAVTAAALAVGFSLCGDTRVDLVLAVGPDAAVADGLCATPAAFRGGVFRADDFLLAGAAVAAGSFGGGDGCFAFGTAAAPVVFV